MRVVALRYQWAGERARTPAGPLQRRGGEAPAQARAAAETTTQPLGREHRRRQRLHALQRDHRRLLRPRSSRSGLFADALFGLIAIVNSYIGIRQELKAKETLDELALLVAPQGEGDPRRRGSSSCCADEVVPGDIVRVEPGDQLVADGEVVASARADPRRVDADRRGRRGPQARRRPRPLGLLLHLRLGLLRGRRGARGELRRARSPARRGPSATRPRRCRRRSTG